MNMPVKLCVVARREFRKMIVNVISDEVYCPRCKDALPTVLGNAAIVRLAAVALKITSSEALYFLCCSRL
jgi:hypothetical protein